MISLVREEKNKKNTDIDLFLFSYILKLAIGINVCLGNGCPLCVRRWFRYLCELMPLFMWTAV